ncbi:MAG TPA: MoxR family ATPase [Angustibacter sp.]|nr:MoxR family ATPase [Angustibacter sp.]
MSEDVMTVQQVGSAVVRVLDELDRVVVGKREALELVLCAVLAGGHVLLEDLPGVGKTVMARSVARVLGLQFTRVQFTPDLLPSDLTGANVLDPQSGSVGFRAGPVFTHVLLADELNRTPPRTQAALLEAMAERQVSTDGTTRALPDPFVVLATENPIEYEGTFSLPEAQLDRFMARVRLGYLDAAQEMTLLRRHAAHETDPAILDVVAGPEIVRSWMTVMEQVEVHDDVLRYAVDLTRATRTHQHVELGSSVRGTMAVVGMARVRAAFSGRDFVTPDDVAAVAVAALGHRISVRPELWLRQVGGDAVVRDVLDQVQPPKTRPGAEP